MDYAEIKIRLDRNADGSFDVSATSPVGEAAGRFESPFSELELENFVLKIGRTRRAVRSVGSTERRSAKEFGERLFNALFQGKVRDLYRMTAAGIDKRKGLRLSLSLTGAPELMNVPWEYMYDEPRFLSQSAQTPIVRYLDLPRARPPLAVTPPLRILAMVSSPTDAVALDSARERANVEAALSELRRLGLVEITWLEQATLPALQRELRRSEYHVFHFIGHGGFDEATSDGVLLLEDETERGRRVSGPDLGVLLFDHPTLRLAVLNACEGARTAADDPFAGVATSLVQQEIPAVVAMQFEITDQAAIVFSRELYGALADGYPIDTAVAEARRAIFFADDNDIEWGTPVLFMRSSDGRLFELGDRGPLPPPPPPSEPWLRRLLASLSRHRWVAVGAAVAALVAAVAAGAVLLSGGSARSALSWQGPDSSGALGEPGVQGLKGVATGDNDEAFAVGYRMRGATPYPAIWEHGSNGWVRARLPLPSGRGKLRGVVHSPAGTVAVGFLETAKGSFPVILAKSSGTKSSGKWTEELGPATGEASLGDRINAVASLPAGYYADGRQPARSIAAGWAEPAFATGYDAVVWISGKRDGWQRRLVADGPGSQTLQAVTTTGKRTMVAAGRDGVDAAIWRSADGTHWSKAQIETQGEIKSVIDDGRELVAAGYERLSKDEVKASVWVSRDDGRKWELLADQPFKESGEQINGLALIGSVVVAVGRGTSKEGKVAAAWTAVRPVTQFTPEQSGALSDGGRGFGLAAVTSQGSVSVVAVGDGPEKPDLDRQQNAQVWRATLR